MTMPKVLTQKYETRALSKLSPHPMNPRTGDVAAIQASIEANNFYGALVVQKKTGYILAGNHRYLAAKAAGIKELPCIVVDVDDKRAQRILLADNKTAMMGTDDAQAILDLITESLDGDPVGTGYSQAELDTLLASLQTDAPPTEFPSVDPDTMQTEHACPKCGYEWSGKAK